MNHNTINQPTKQRPVTCIVPTVGSLIKYKDKHSRSIDYVKVDGFYNILPEYGGGRGFSYTMLNGSGNGSTPECHVEKIKQFSSLEEMQADYNDGNKEIF